MFNIFKKRGSDSQAVNSLPQGTDIRPSISDVVVARTPEHKSSNGLSISYTPTPQAGIRYPDLGPFDKREIFRHDARKMIYHRGRRYAMAYVASETARKLQIDFLISEYRGIMDTLIKALKHEIDKKEAVFNTGNELVQEQLKPIIDGMRETLLNMQEQHYQAIESEGEISHAITAFNRGWDLGAMKVLRNIDLKDRALDDIDSREETGEL